MASGQLQSIESDVQGLKLGSEAKQSESSQDHAERSMAIRRAGVGRNGHDVEPDRPADVLPPRQWIGAADDRVQLLFCEVAEAENFPQQRGAR